MPEKREAKGEGNVRKTTGAVELFVHVDTRIPKT